MRKPLIECVILEAEGNSNILLREKLLKTGLPFNALHKYLSGSKVYSFIVGLNDKKELNDLITMLPLVNQNYLLYTNEKRELFSVCNNSVFKHIGNLKSVKKDIAELNETYLFEPIHGTYWIAD